ncbi:selenium-dependent xanthine dehydrogenase [Clostridium sp. DSM 100503]|uniref:selenium-dependent xanthine dehydrogenase n=1 Tax=Clostridium sp. DSM 100503 TaxID=2963282 RepID=UPI00214A7639|nr:selenium-dependent xanthine dehydrogenase [Clostridium sp. DSM 100503]MCR1952592.1 selenium-dependent xanthine dehydrogenase [Clostridium sp. DSM 100503]
MYSFKLNGKSVSVNEDMGLLDYLRDIAQLTSVKNGCAEGACGACMVLIDGVAQRACIQKLSRLENKEVITVEGISERERDVFAYAFGKCGAVQCGFCIPGMVISAKGLLDKNLNPTEDEIKIALKGNICRCTGYVKIIKAINLVAELLRNDEEVPKVYCKGLVGENLPRIDAEVKTLGIGKYADDLYFDEMLYGSALRSKYPRALVKNIDTSKAKALDGVYAVLTAKDIPGDRFIGHLVQDWPAMIDIGEETRYLGDAVALVAARDKKILKEALNLIEVDYEELSPVINPEMGMKDDAPKVHESGSILSRQYLKRGDADEAIKNSKYVVTEKYSTPPTEHAFLEPECAVANYEDGILTVYTGGQGVYDELREIGKLLNLDPSQLRIKSMLVGGGFGGKEDMSVQHHAALLTYYTKKPVKVALSRKESIIIHPKRHAMEMEFTTACNENGILTGMKARIISDTGAYASLGGAVLQRACTHAAGPYNYQNVEIEGIAVYTNNPPAGAFRGFGVTQSAFANECNINKLAELVGISSWEFRYKNAIRPGQVLPNGQIADEGTALVETLEAVKDAFENNKNVGISCAFKNAGLGVGIPDTGRCRIVIKDGKAVIRTSAACIGQGVGTIATQILCETTGIKPNEVLVDNPDTFTTPNSGTTTASRQTVFTGEATRAASLKLKAALENKSLEELEGEEFYGEYVSDTDPMGSTKPNPVSHVAYGYATQVVVLDDNGKVLKVVAAHDIGRAVNPIAVEGQIEGGVVMGLGYALTEDYPLKDGVPLAKFGTLGLFRSTGVPEIETILIEKNKSSLAYGAKGVGEIVVVPAAPAMQGAYYKLDGEFRTKLPLENTYYRKLKK